MAIIRILFLFFGLLLGFGGATRNQSESIGSIALQESKSITFLNATHSKLLHHGRIVEPKEIWVDKCKKEYIGINQSPTRPLPSGIPTYTVEIINKCNGGCTISNIHFSCGWFSSANVINPKVFKRLSYNNCLVNDGKPLQFGSAISFSYANTFSYPLSVTTLTCM